jgi:hypothetical protein
MPSTTSFGAAVKYLSVIGAREAGPQKIEKDAAREGCHESQE